MKLEGWRALAIVAAVSFFAVLFCRVTPYVRHILDNASAAAGSLDISKCADDDNCIARAAAYETRWQGRWTAASFFVGILTLLGIGFGFWQNDRSRRHEYRAYIGIYLEDDIQWPNQIRPDGEIHSEMIKFKVRNYGRSPALNVRYAGDSYLGEIDRTPPEALPANTSANASLILHPSGDTDFGVYVHLSNREKRMIYAGVRHVYITVVVSYTDIFGAPHITRAGFKVTRDTLEHNTGELWDYHTEAS